MEGNNITDNYPEQQQYPEKKKGQKLPLVIGIIIGLIIGIIISPFIMDMFSEDKPETPKTPIYQQYTIFESDNTTVYYNEQLNVSITRTPSHYEAYQYHYHITSSGVDGHSGNFSGFPTPTALYDMILEFAEEFSEDELKWFDYMFNNVVE